MPFTIPVLSFMLSHSVYTEKNNLSAQGIQSRSTDQTFMAENE